MIIISLIGEQPMSNLLPILDLSPLPPLETPMTSQNLDAHPPISPLHVRRSLGLARSPTIRVSYNR